MRLDQFLLSFDHFSYKRMTTPDLLEYCKLPCSDMTFTFGLPATVRRDDVRRKLRNAQF